ncbi:hypothetical protein NEDG_01742 [Nematocida displodere]|uniref:Uncharacterized protein n=1 Tax=Nematocida displodere TaxID=1805483 RepID=A0A177EGN8_9MICR|nr:hypothetical protein NEDG_01742 [Nematocida displodere]
MKEIDIKDILSEINIERTREREKCKICYEPETEENKLCFPCKCRDLTESVHKECIVEWMKKTGTRACKTCNRKIKTKNIPTRDRVLRTEAHRLKNPRKLLFKSLRAYAKNLVSCAAYSALYPAASSLARALVETSAGIKTSLSLRLSAGTYLLGWLVCHAAREVLARMAAVGYLILFKARIRRLGVSETEDVEFTDDSTDSLDESYRERTMKMLSLVTNSANFPLFTRSPVFPRRTSTQSASEMCTILEVIVLEDDILLEKKNRLKDAANALAHHSPLLKGLVRGYRKDRMYRALIELVFGLVAVLLLGVVFILLPSVVSCGLAASAGLAWRNLRAAARTRPALSLFRRLGLAGLSGRCPLSPRGAKMLKACSAGALLSKISAVDRGFSPSEVLRVDGYTGCAAKLFFGLAALMHLLRRKKQVLSETDRHSRQKKAYNAIYIAFKFWVLFSLDYLVFPLLTGMVALSCAGILLNSAPVLIGRHFYIGDRLATLLGVYVATGYVMMHGIAHLVKRRVAPTTRPGVEYWIVPKRSHYVVRAAREKLSNTLVEIFTAFAVPVAVILGATAPFALARWILKALACFHATWVPNETPAEEMVVLRCAPMASFLGHAYMWSLCLAVFRRGIQAFFVEVVEHAVYFFGRVCAGWFGLGLVLYDEPIPLNEINNLERLCYLPSLKSTDYKMSDVKKRRTLTVTETEKSFYFSKDGRKKQTFPRDKLMNMPVEDHLWVDMLLHSERDELLYSPFYSVYHVPSLVHLRVGAFLLVVAAVSILYTTILLLLAAALWKVGLLVLALIGDFELSTANANANSLPEQLRLFVYGGALGYGFVSVRLWQMEGRAVFALCVSQALAGLKLVHALMVLVPLSVGISTRALLYLFHPCVDKIACLLPSGGWLLDSDRACTMMTLAVSINHMLFGIGTQTTVLLLVPLLLSCMVAMDVCLLERFPEDARFLLRVVLSLCPFALLFLRVVWSSLLKSGLGKGVKNNRFSPTKGCYSPKKKET